ncbi:MAG: hypothetical protein SVV67_07095, partial [Bacillota bacterium]|nr:hypothetical protein [Bacillota bacterium]
LDGLYANGPVMEICFKHRWKFMIVFKEKSLPSLWREANALSWFSKMIGEPAGRRLKKASAQPESFGQRHLSARIHLAMCENRAAGL